MNCRNRWQNKAGANRVDLEYPARKYRRKFRVTSRTPSRHYAHHVGGPRCPSRFRTRSSRATRTSMSQPSNGQTRQNLQNCNLKTHGTLRDKRLLYWQFHEISSVCLPVQRSHSEISGLCLTRQQRGSFNQHLLGDCDLNSQSAAACPYPPSPGIPKPWHQVTREHLRLFHSGIGGARQAS